MNRARGTSGEQAAYEASARPRLRPVEGRQVESDGQMMFAVFDPTGLSDSVLTVSEPVLFVLAKFDGKHTLDAIREAFAEQLGGEISEEELAGIHAAVGDCHFLAGDAFEAYYRELVEAYRAAPSRPMRSAADLALIENTSAVLDELLTAGPANGQVAGRIAGVIAPHLDYPRGKPCYAAAYGALRARQAPRRIVILGTNHFGRSHTVSATRKAFATPLGTTRVDAAFLARLEAACGDLCEFELDHAREHSVELQLLICQHLWGADAFEFVPLLCPDPCGPTGTLPRDGRGMDLGDFGRVLGELLRDDPVDTLLIAGADLSHVGRQFGDERDLDATFAAEVERRDREALDQVAGNDAAAFVAQVAREDNPTRVCSAGCIFAVMQALPDARVHMLGYHQAFDPAADTGVTCCAAAFAA